MGSDHQVSTKSGQRSSSPYLRTRKDHSLFENMARTTAALLAFAAIAGVAFAADDSNIGSRHAVDVKKAAEEMRSVDESIGSGKLYFTGTGYTVNLIPHAIVLGLLTFAIIFLYGDSLFGTDVSDGYGAPEVSYGAPAASYGAPASSYGAPSSSYGAPSYAAQRYYDTYAADAASGLVADPYNPE